jgi:hypothetical protein
MHFAGRAVGLKGAACGLLAASMIIFLPTLMIVADSLKIKSQDLFSGYARPLFASILTLLALRLVDSTFDADRLGHVGYVALQVTAGASSYLFALLVLLRLDTTDIRTLFKLRQS